SCQAKRGNRALCFQEILPGTICDVGRCAPLDATIPKRRLGCLRRAPAEDVGKLLQPLHFPQAVEPGQTGLTAEELLHGSPFKVALLGDEPVQHAQKLMHIAQRLRDRVLFGERLWKRDGTRKNIALAKIRLVSTIVERQVERISVEFVEEKPFIDTSWG